MITDNTKGGFDVLGSLKKVVSKQSSNPTSVRVNLPNSLFPVIDPDQVAHDCHLLEEAIDLGKRDLPTSDQSTRFGTAEMNIDTEIQRVVIGYHSNASSKVLHLDDFIESEATRARQSAASARLLPNGFNQEVNSYLAKNQTEYSNMKEEFRLTRDEYVEFRKVNALNRIANVRSDAHKTLALIIGAVLIFVEAVANSAFFSTNLEGGLVMGFAYAALASAMNVVFAGFVGYKVVRYINHVNIVKKIGGLLGILIVAVWVLLIGLMVAHFRDALQLVEPELAASRALETFTNAPFVLADIQSWVLFAVTLCFGLGAMLDGYNYDDPYPNYSHIFIKYSNVAQDWAEYLESRRNHIVELQQSFVEGVRTTVNECDGHMVSIERALQEKEACLSAYQSALRSADKAYQTLVSLFRNENRKHRTTAPPSYFESEIVLDLTELPEVRSRIKSEMLDELRLEIKTLRQDAESIRAEILNAFNEQEAKIQLEKEGVF